jgi:hypothetical protein
MTINNHPQFVQQIPLHYIASYLELLKDILSRIRASILIRGINVHVLVGQECTLHSNKKQLNI